MSKYVDRELEPVVDYFTGSVETYGCPPLEACYACGGNGRCTSCHGQGEVRCSRCDGHGQTRCSCGGGGVCRTCHGTGGYSVGDKWNTCLSCHGSGKCDICNGSGTIDCNACNRTGYVSCYSCHGSGNCSTCGGSGNLTCSRCMGTGFYQQYLQYKASILERQYCHPGTTPDLLEGLRIAEGDMKYSATSSAWKRAGMLDFDDTEKSLNLLCEASPAQSNLTSEFCQELKSMDEMNESIAGYSKYKNDHLSQVVKCTRVNFNINNTDYALIFMGDNNVVVYDDLPVEINLFKMDPVDKAKMKTCSYRRHMDIALLTAYIFNLDGIDPVESKTLNLIFKHMCLNSLQRERMLRYLKNRYTADVPAKVILKKVRRLLQSRKAACYVWQCIGIDKQISPVEEYFFKRVTSYYKMGPAEVKSIKRYAEKFSTLNQEELIKEYLDSEPVYRDPYYTFWNILMALSAIASIVAWILYFTMEKGKGWAILFAVACVSLFVSKSPFMVYDQKSVDKLYKTVSGEEEVTEVVYASCTLPYRVWYGVVNKTIEVCAKFQRLIDKYVKAVF